MEHSGHRRRLIKRFQEEALSQHEQLEILLFNAIPRRNTSDLAHRLLARFGTVEDVLHAPMETLKSVDGVGDGLAAYLCVIGSFLESNKKSVKKKFYGEFDADEFLAYVNVIYENEPSEVLDLYLLNATGEVFRHHRFTDGKVNRIEIDSRDFLGVLLKEKPSGIVLVHNHPENGADPSDHDDETTRYCEKICSLYGILFCDHIIYSKDAVYSYFLSGRLDTDEKKRKAFFKKKEKKSEERAN